MRIVALDRRVVCWRLDGRGAARGLRYRTAIVVELRDDRGVCALGEAAPLPGMSVDTLDDAAAALDAFAGRLPLEVDDDVLEAIASASARFAIETAVYSLAASESVPTTNDARKQATGDRRQATGDSGQQATGDRRQATGDAQRVVSAIVIDSVEEAREAYAAGVRCLKIKVGADGGLDRVRAIAASVPEVMLRIDANRSWPREHVRAWLEAIADLRIEYVEEPCVDAHELLDHALPCPIALDESLASLSPAQIDRALASPSLAALVLKPTLLGMRTCIELAHRAHAAGKSAIVTHTLESAIGRAACLELALAIADPSPAGLAGQDPDGRLSPVACRLSPVSDHRLSPVAGRLSPVSGDAKRIDDPLTIDDSDADLPAVITATETLSFRDVAAHASSTSLVVIAHPTLDTIAAIHRALHDARPIALLHPALPAAERARQQLLVEHARLPADAALILFTSGSTGLARGVVLSRAALVAAADANMLGWQADDAWHLGLPLAHAGGLAVVVRCLVARRPIVLGPLERATLASMVPTQLAALLDDPAWRPNHLRAVLLGGAAASPSLLDHAAARGVPFVTTYGTTESFGQLATARTPGDPHAPLVPLPGVSITGGTRESPAPLRIRGPMLATRYLDGTRIAPELVTADLGYVDADGVHIVGRADDVIITGGENVHPATVEAVLAATPGVRAACAFAVPDERWGQIVGAAIASDADIDDAARAAWHAALPPHARPRELAIVRSLPELANGKLDRRAAARLPRAPVRYR